MLTIIVTAIIIGLLPAAIAHGKGRSFFKWWFYGAALWIVAFPWSLMLKRDVQSLDARAVQAGEGKKCPDCAEIVKADARVCRFCQHRFEEPLAPTAETAEFDHYRG